MNKTCFCGGNLFEITDTIFVCQECGSIHDENKK